MGKYIATIGYYILGFLFKQRYQMMMGLLYGSLGTASSFLLLVLSGRVALVVVVVILVGDSTATLVPFLGIVEPVSMSVIVVAGVIAVILVRKGSVVVGGVVVPLGVLPLVSDFPSAGHVEAAELC